MNFILKIFSLRILSTILSIIASIITIRIYGAERVVDVFFAAQSLVFMVRSLSQTGQLSEFFLPKYHELKRESLDKAFTSLNVILNRISIALVLGFIVIAILTPYIIEILVPGYSNEDKYLATLIFLTLLPTILFQFLSSFFLTILNAENKFGRPEVLAIVNTLLNIIIIISFFDSLKIWALVLANVIFTFVIFFSYYYEIYRMGYRYKFVLRTPGFDHKDFFSIMKTTLYYAVSTQIFSFTLTATVSYLPAGSFAIYNYSKNLADKAYALLIQPIVTVFFTKISFDFSDRESSISLIKKYAKLLNIVVVFLISGSILFGESVLSLMWQSKNFDANNVKLAAVIFLFNIISIYFTANGAILRKLNVTEGKARRLYMYMAVGQILSAIVSYIFINKFGILGLYAVIILNSILTTYITNLLLYRKSKYYANLFSMKIVLDITIYVILFFINGFVDTLDSTGTFKRILLFLVLNGYNIYYIIKLIKNENY
jgi:putative peptidoglycan lipid II flippase